MAGLATSTSPGTDLRQPLEWDIFCAVVDNYGDAGVCWRLARQLAREFGARVRLWIDHPHSLARLVPEVDPARAAQACLGVEIRHWTEPFAGVAPGQVGDVVVEAFACRLPAAFVAAMQARARLPVWINLEYLSAEDWVPGCHGLPSPQPRSALVKHFYFPGFVAGTGGLLRERALAAERDAFQDDPQAMADFWRSLGLTPAGAGEARVSLFCYDNPALSGLLAAWSTGEQAVCCLVPEGRAVAGVCEFFGVAGAVPGTPLRRGQLEVRPMPFLPQQDYDRLLWACDCNFVRGEDSFVRAQWALRPWVWHIYPQQEDAHHAKLAAFLARYGAGLAPQPAAALGGLWNAWNAGDGASWPQLWQGFWSRRAEFEAHARRWADDLAKVGDLATNLFEFCEKRLE